MMNTIAGNIGFSSDTIVMLEKRKLSMAEMLENTASIFKGYSIDKTVSSTLITSPQVVGIGKYVSIEINGKDKVVCGLDQLFYLQDGSSIYAKDLRTTHKLAGALPDMLGLISVGRPIVVNYKYWTFSVTGVKYYSDKIELISVLSETDKFLLGSNICVAARPKT